MAVLSFTAIVTVAGGLGAFYCFGLAIYRLYFHPLAKFPGSKLAALTLWYEFYYDVVKRGQYIWKIQEMHKRYGPIIRINPEELHVDDPDYYDELYGSATRKRDKYGPWVALTGTLGSSFATVNHNQHRIRRSALNPFFSKMAVTKLEPLIQEKIDKLESRFEKAMKTGEIIRTDAAYTALTMDLICQYSFAMDDNYLEEDDFKVAWKETLTGAFEGGAMLRQFPWMFPMMNALPETWLATMQPGMKLMLEWRAGVRRRVQPILERTETAEELQKATHRSIFHEMRDSSLPPHERTLDRLCDEGQILTGAGSETTAQTLAVLTFYLLRDRVSLEKLKVELRTIMPTPKTKVRWAAVEQLPFLSAVISEGLRISIGVTTRLPRVATDEILRYKEWEIPFGTPVSETNYFVLMNPTIFPKPDEFLPERWLKNGEYNRALDKYLVTFGRGSRQCLGMNLAYAELYLTVATIFRRFEMELFGTTVDDVVTVHDFFTPVPRLDSKGVRVKVIGESKE